VYIAYADESGDSGYNHTPSQAFVLSILLVHESDWLKLLDRLVAMRRYLKKAYGISVTITFPRHSTIRDWQRPLSGLSKTPRTAIPRSLTSSSLQTWTLTLLFATW